MLNIFFLPSTRTSLFNDKAPRQYIVSRVINVPLDPPLNDFQTLLPDFFVALYNFEKRDEKIVK